MNVFHVLKIDAEVIADDCIYSHGFIMRVLSRVADLGSFNIELARNGNLPPVWFCWDTFEKSAPDRDTIKFYSFTCKVVKDWSVEAMNEKTRKQ